MFTKCVSHSQKALYRENCLRFSAAVIRHCNQKSLEEKRGYFSYTSTPQLIDEGSWGRKSRQELSGSHGEILLSALLAMVGFFLLSYIIRTTFSGGALSTMGRAHPHQSAIRKMLHSHAYRFLFSGDPSLSKVDQKASR